MKYFKKVVSLLLFLALVLAIVLYAMGVFTGEQIQPGREPAPPGEPPPSSTAVAAVVEVPVAEEAVGTVASRTRVAISAQVQARVLEVHAEAGQRVEAKKPLVVLDDRELASRKAQAEDALRQAEAARERAVQSKARASAVRDQAVKHFERIGNLVQAKAATPEQLEQAEAQLLQADAGVADATAAIAAGEARIAQAAQVVREAEVALGYTTIANPLTGVVATKSVEPGDIAWPGKTLLEVLDPDALRLEAQVREGLICLIERGAAYEVEIPAAGVLLQGTVAEIYPTADPRSRTFKVRVDLGEEECVKPGMYGRLRIPTGTRRVVRVPRAAVTRVGQLEVVLVRSSEGDGEPGGDGGVWARRTVRTGRDLPEGHVEVLSGLAGGETIGLPESR